MEEENKIPGSFSYSPFIKTICDNIEYNDMLMNGEKVVVAVSGGPDSVCLLEVLLRIRKKFGIELLVANVDHGIRKKSSKKDSEFVRSLADEYDLFYEHEKIDLKHESLSELSTEEAARKKRYDFLLNVARKNNANIVATGHTQNDQAETVLMRVIWGSTLAGLSGIYPVRAEGEIKVIRPLMRTSKEDVFLFLDHIKSEYCDDLTNKDTVYRRNKIRHEILPVLRKCNPNVLNTVSDMADSLREDHIFLQEEKERYLLGKQLAMEKKEILLSDFVLLPKTVRRKFFKKMYQDNGGKTKYLKYRHWKEVDNMAKNPKNGSRLDLPGQLVVEISEGKLLFRQRSID